MKKLQKLTAVLLSLLATVSLCACSSGSGTDGGSTANENTPSSANEHYSIGIIQMMDHEALNASREGFLRALGEQGLVDGENLTVNYQNGQGDQNNLGTIADQFIANNEDLVFAIATPAAQAVASKTNEIPIVATAITSFTEAGLAESDDVPGMNVTGTTDMNPISAQIELILEIFPDTKTIGFLYNSAEDNSILQVAIAKEIAESKGIAVTERTVQNTNDVQQAVASIIDECDAIYIPTDNVFASSMPIVNEIAVPAKIPVFGGEGNMVKSGAFGTLGISYDSIGYQAGLMAADILLNGKDPANMSIESSNDYQYLFNKEYVDALGVTLPEKYAQYAE